MKPSAFTSPGGMAVSRIACEGETAIPQPNCIPYTVGVLEDARLLATQVEDIVARILGHVPSAGSTKDEGAPDGVFPWLDQQSRVTQSRLIEAREALLRLERAI